MIKLVSCCLIFVVSSCGAGWSDYSEKIGEGYVWVNEGEGFNAILSDVKGVNDLFNLKKYYNNGTYICAWQVDSARLASPNFRPDDLKVSTDDPSDRFYIIDTEKKRRYGPYRKEDFFTKAELLNIHVSWQPVTR